MKIKKASEIFNFNTHKKKNFSKTKPITTKASNASSIRVLYKKPGQVPELKIIDNILRLKKAIVRKNLDIIPYETVYIIFINKKNQSKTKNPNIVLDFYNITGDLILVDIDKNKREFKGLTQEDVIWYTQDLINKSFNSNNTTNNSSTSIQKEHRQKAIYNSERDFENKSSTSFEQALLQVLVNIELVLASMLQNNKNGDLKNG